MSVQEILTAIDELPPEQRKALFAEIDEQRGITWVPQYMPEETPEQTEAIRRLVREGLESGPPTPLDMDAIIRGANAEWESGGRAS